jgi:hypothetical protein
MKAAIRSAGDGACPVSARRPGEQVVEDAADPPGQDRGLGGIALGGFQVAWNVAPAGVVVAAYAVGAFQLPPPQPFHGEAVSSRERLPDHHVAVALEALDVC